MMKAVSDDRRQRKFERVPLTGEAQVVELDMELQVGEQSADAKVINIAEEGLYLDTAAPLERRVEVEIDLVIDGQTTSVVGTIVWKSHKGVGIRLKEVSESFRQLVRRMAAADPDERSQMIEAISSARVRVV